MLEWLQDRSEISAHIELFYEVFREQLRDVDVRNNVVQKLNHIGVLSNETVTYVLSTENREEQISRLINIMSRYVTQKLM